MCVQESMNTEPRPQKRLVLHFDVNSTITAVDSTEEGTDEQNANMLLAKSCFGKVSLYDHNWTLNPCKEQWFKSSSYVDITYYDYLKLRTPDYKKQSFVFTQHGMPGHLLADLVTPIALSFKSLVFQSFTRVVSEYLGDENTTFVFRTFGHDGEAVLMCLVDQGYDDFGDHNMVKCEFIHEGNSSSLIVHHPLRTVLPNDSIRHLNALVQKNKNKHFLVKEDYNYWNNNKRGNQRVAEFGKQLLGEPDAIHIFFDDNECVNIVSGNEDDKTEAYFVKVNPIEALQNINFFSEWIDKLVSQ